MAIELVGEVLAVDVGSLEHVSVEIVGGDGGAGGAEAEFAGVVPDGGALDAAAGESDGEGFEALLPPSFSPVPPQSGKWNHIVGQWFGLPVAAIGQTISQAIGELQDPVEVVSACRCLPEEGDAFDGLMAHNGGSRG